MPRNEFALTRSVYPYSLYVIICTGLFLLGLFDLIRIKDPSPMYASLAVALFVIVMMYPDTRYRIFWKDGVIRQVSVNKFVTTISCAKITCIAQERSDLQRRMRMQRPLDRIAIYAGQGAQEKHIDVSLRHFTSDDIRKLMRAIHERLPDLTIPRHWA